MISKNKDKKIRGLDDKGLKGIVGRVLEILLRWFYKTKYFIQDWVRIPREATIWMKMLLLGIYGLAFFLLLTLAIDINFLWLFGRSVGLFAAQILCPHSPQPHSPRRLRRRVLPA